MLMFVCLQVMPNGSLYVSEVYMEDMGKYGCTAGNSGGFEREEIYLNVASKSHLTSTYSKRRVFITTGCTLRNVLHV